MGDGGGVGVVVVGCFGHDSIGRRLLSLALHVFWVCVKIRLSIVLYSACNELTHRLVQVQSQRKAREQDGGERNNEWHEIRCSEFGVHFVHVKWVVDTEINNPEQNGAPQHDRHQRHRAQCREMCGGPADHTRPLCCNVLSPL